MGVGAVMNVGHEPFAWFVAAAIFSVFGIIALFVGFGFGAIWLIGALVVAVVLLAISAAQSYFDGKGGL